MRFTEAVFGTRNDLFIDEILTNSLEWNSNHKSIVNSVLFCALEETKPLHKLGIITRLSKF